MTWIAKLDVSMLPLCLDIKKTEKYTSETQAHYNNSQKERQALSVIELTPLNG